MQQKLPARWAPFNGRCSHWTLFTYLLQLLRALGQCLMSAGSSPGQGAAQAAGSSDNGSGVGEGRAGSQLRPSLTLRFNRAKAGPDELADAIGVVGARGILLQLQLSSSFAAHAQPG